jgi:endonuclease/exonuclease/phosphatase family metal-dependent hydrolase
VFAHKALRGIDNSIAKIYWHAFHSTRRNYDVWIYSDHGQEDSDSYVEKLGITVKKAIEKVYKKFDGGNSARTEDDRIIANAVQDDDHQGVQTHRTRYLGDWFTRWLFSLIGVTYETDELRNKGMGEGVIVTAIGPTGNIYLPRKLQNEERDRFARSLVANAGIPAVLSPDGPGQVSVWNKNGQFRLPEHAREIIGGDHMYLEEITEDLIRLCHHSQGGDFTFLGWSPGDTPLTFPIESGAHAGPGKEETNAFALLPCDIVSSLDEPAFLRTRDLRQSALKFLGRMDPKEPGPAPMPVSLPTRETAPASRTLRVMTYNVHSCIGMDGKISPERIARLIGRHHPDVVALQELDLMRARTGGEDQPHIIAKELEMMYHFHPNMIVEEEHYGNAILSRYPVELVKTVQLPGLLHKPDLEPRGAMWCCIDLGGVKLQLINTHLGLRSAERLRQVRMLCGSQWLEHPRCTGPVILCGDFNALPGSPVCRQIRRKLRDAQFEMKDHSPRATWFSRYPVGRIDHVFVSPEIEVTNVVVSQTDLDKKYSDHLPLIIDISFSSRILQNTTSTNETHS